ncbi:hypothetical protein OIE62_03710 [Streptomyces scopuliridis]|uniref:Uncharacterized protein n=1 Tax=Streptomyces scopuliridis TaxID=452529 RepID=A0ACD4ZUV5_9ACTN|nr:hypothetical protein [Streptomyces scopuliridis]WSB37791.1 hypothetical protein OG949_36525 [Streptomyces scopuliridis]WSC02246.1 hypothetical protein OG835_38120 [Streptomyces scopuliridis]WSC04217.1 hypothetical protein OIE62_03710 [Streptomyces scopuliridis]
MTWGGVTEHTAGLYAQRLAESHRRHRGGRRFLGHHLHAAATVATVAPAA